MAGSITSPKKRAHFSDKYELFVTDSYRRGMEADKMYNKMRLACKDNTVLPRAPEFQGQVSSLCNTDLRNRYVDPRERKIFFSEGDGPTKHFEYATIHHDVLEDEMI